MSGRTLPAAHASARPANKRIATGKAEKGDALKAWEPSMPDGFIHNKETEDE